MHRVLALSLLLTLVALLLPGAAAPGAEAPAAPSPTAAMPPPPAWLDELDARPACQSGIQKPPRNRSEDIVKGARNIVVR